jgi:3-isopropylmalate/(R)-2-methylmalate dehydratase small subunit
MSAVDYKRRQIDGRGIPVPGNDIDTDRIIPARFLKRPRGPDYAGFLFHDLRFDGEGREKPDFALNRPAWRDARIIVADANFGCGSSREGAVWALAAYGVRAVIAPSFGDLFFNNSLKNGLLPIVLPAEATARLRHVLTERPGSSLTIDLPAETVASPDGGAFRFAIDPFEKRCLVEGLDDLGLTLRHADEIAAFEQRREREAAWLPRIGP